MKKYAALISKGALSPLETVKFHHRAPVKRFVMLQKDSVKGDGMKVVIHKISKLPKKIPSYCDLHQHDFDEVNLILSDSGTLKYRIRLEEETYDVKAPSTIYIPAGTRHSAEVISGTGTYVTLLMTSTYTAKG